MRNKVTSDDAMIASAIAMFCVILIFGSSRVVKQLLEGSPPPRQQRQEQQQTLTPPTPHSKRPIPRSLADCRHGRWKRYVGFISEDACVYFVTADQ